MVSSSPVILISAAPHSISPEEHEQLVASTPVSFNDIPPVLRLHQDDISIEFDPPVEGLTPHELANGSLYIIESVLAFISSSSGKGFQVLYPSIAIHAVSRAGDRPMVYCQLELELEKPAPNEEAPPRAVPVPNGPAQGEGAQAQEEQEQEDDDLIDVVEMKIYPRDPTKIDAIFETLSHCAALHPDLNNNNNNNNDDNDDNGAIYTRRDFDDDDDDDETFAGTDEAELSEVGRAALEHLESIIVYPPGMQPPPSSASADADADAVDETLTNSEA